MDLSELEEIYFKSTEVRADDATRRVDVAPLSRYCVGIVVVVLVVHVHMQVRIRDANSLIDGWHCDFKTSRKGAWKHIIRASLLDSNQL